MERNYVEDKEFVQIDFAVKSLGLADYDNCTFINCNFSDTDLSKQNFSECIFKGCNLSMVKLGNTVFNDVKFKNCKMLGLHFEDCNQFLLTVSLTLRIFINTLSKFFYLTHRHIEK